MTMTKRMGWRQLLGQWISGKDLETVSRPYGGGGDIDLWGVTPVPSQDNLISSYKGTAYACANLCADGVAGTPLRLYVRTGKRDAAPNVLTRKVPCERLAWLAGSAVQAKRLTAGEDVEEVLEHPLLDLLETVNIELDGFTLIEITQLYLEVTGSAYWWLPRNTLGVLDVIWILQPQLIRAKRDKKNTILSYQYGRGPKMLDIPAEEVLPFFRPNLRNPYAEGWSPLRAAYESVMLEEKDRANTAAILDNRARPDLIISAKGELGGLGEDESERLERRFRRKFHKGRSGGVLVISDEIDIKPLTFSPRDTQAALLHGLTKEDIANAFGVPLSLLQTKDVNRANAEAGHYQLARNAILPRCRRLEERLSQRLCPLFDPRLFLAFDNPVPADRDFQLRKRDSDLKNGVITINEARATDGREAIDGGDVPFLPVNLLPIGSVPATETAEAGSSPIKAIGSGPLALVAPSSRVLRRERTWTLPDGKALAQTVRGQFRKQKAAILRRFKAITKAAWTPPTGLFDDANWAAFDKEMSGKCSGHLMVDAVKGARKHARELVTHYGDEWSAWEVSPTRLSQAMDRASMKFAHETNKTTRQELNAALANLRRDLAEGILAPDNSVRALTTSVNKIFESAETWRAQRIAVTESSSAIHEGERIAALESKMVRGVRPLVAADACDICQEIAAEYPMLDLNTPFVSGEGMYGTLYHPPFHPNCVCSQEMVFA